MIERKHESVLGEKRLKDLGFSKAQRQTPGILMPLWGVDGKGVVGYQFRPDNPRLNAKGKPVKYETPLGASNHLDCPPRCQKQLKDPLIPLWITEGIKKVDCLATLGETVLGVTGVWNWKGKNEVGGITITNDFDYIALNGRTVYIVYDSDLITNRSVMLALRRLAEHLSSKGAKVFIVHLPQDSANKVGIDDFIASGHTVDEAKALAKPLEDDAEVRTEQGTKDNRVYQAYFWAGDKLYLEVLRRDESYAFAYLKDTGEVGFMKEVAVKDKMVMPTPLPVREGIPKFIVGLPTDDIALLKSATPDDLYDRLKAHFQTYFDLSEADIELCIYYAIFTWFYPKINTLGYLRFIADTGKGKSRIQKVVSDVCFYPLYAAGASSFSGMARMQEKWRGTLVVDESDFAGDKEAQLTKYLNLGFEEGKYYVLSDKQNPQRQEVFDPFCPKIMAMRSTFEDNAVEGRLLSISPYETSNPNIPIILDSKYKQAALALRNEMALFALHHWNQVDGERLLSFDDLKLEPRLKQLAIPLSVIFQIWPQGIQPFREYLLRRQQEIEESGRNRGMAAYSI